MQYGRVVVFISSHAAGRLRERDPRGRPAEKVMPIVRRRLREKLLKGVRPDSFGAVHIEIGEGLVAVCCPGMGRWDVSTFYGGGRGDEQNHTAANRRNRNQMYF